MKNSGVNSFLSLMGFFIFVICFIVRKILINFKYYWGNKSYLSWIHRLVGKLIFLQRKLGSFNQKGFGVNDENISDLANKFDIKIHFWEIFFTKILKVKEANDFEYFYFRHAKASFSDFKTSLKKKKFLSNSSSFNLSKNSNFLKNSIIYQIIFFNLKKKKIQLS